MLTGPVRGWQGQELTSLGDIVHMGSVAVGPDHRDRYFVLFPQTLLILSVSHRMSAFIYEVHFDSWIGTRILLKGPTRFRENFH